MSVLCKSKTASFEEVVRCILTDDRLESNKYLAEFEKYDLLTAFWQQVEVVFGYTDPKPTLQKFVMACFATYASRSITAEMPQAWKPFISYKSGNIIAFLDNLMNSYLYGERFDEISELAYEALGAAGALSKLPVEALVDCCVFAGVDKLLIAWIMGRLESEDLDAKLGGKTIPEICMLRRKMHFGKRFRSEYFILENAFYIMAPGLYVPVTGIENIVKQYTAQDYLIDRRYRYFYLYFDRLESSADFERLRDLVENIYTNDYLNKQIVNWNQSLTAADGKSGLPQQLDFYSRFVRNNKERTVVIISDALRYEVGRTLFEKIQADEKYSFAGSGLKTISIPRSVFWVGEGVYSDCKRLNNVVVPDNIISIPDKMFSGCGSLSEIKLPETVDSIGADAFRDCSSLQSIVIPESVHSIGENAFSGTHPKFTLLCHRLSEAEKYARSHDITFQIIY